MPTSAYRGVSCNSGKWKAKIRFMGRDLRAGGAHTREEDAAKALDKYLYKLHALYGHKIVEQVLQVGLSGEEKAALDGMSLDELEVTFKKFSSGVSRYRGVSSCHPSGRWRATISRDGKTVHLGRYDTEEQAAQAYDRAAVANSGRRALTNFALEKYASELAEHESRKQSVLGPNAMQSAGTSTPAPKPARQRKAHRLANPRPVKGPPEDHASHDNDLCGYLPSEDNGIISESDCETDDEDAAVGGVPGWVPRNKDGVPIWNQPLSPFNIPDGGLDSPDDEEEKQRQFDESMKNPNFRLYMERRMTKGSVEPNLHILSSPPIDPWPFFLREAEPAPRPKPFNKYKAVAHLCPGGLEGLLSDSESGCDSEEGSEEDASANECQTPEAQLGVGADVMTPGPPAIQHIRQAPDCPPAKQQKKEAAVSYAPAAAPTGCSIGEAAASTFPPAEHDHLSSEAWAADMRLLVSRLRAKVELAEVKLSETAALGVMSHPDIIYNTISVGPDNGPITQVEPSRSTEEELQYNARILGAAEDPNPRIEQHSGYAIKTYANGVDAICL